VDFEAVAGARRNVGISQRSTGQAIRWASSFVWASVQRPLSLRRSAVVFALLVAVFAASGLTACSPGKRTGAKPASSAKPSARAAKTPDASALALCTALHDLPAKRRATCCAETPIAVYVDECVRLLSSAVRAGKVRLDDAAVARCAARVEESTRGCDWIAPTLTAAPAECASALSGLVPEGGRCVSSLECSGALHCAGQGASTPGVCKPPQPLEAGCGTSVDSLATYLSLRDVERRKPACADFCALSSHRCEPKPAAGTACHASVNCASDQTCTNGRCEPREHPERSALASSGGACQSDPDCASGGCVTAPDGARTCAKKCSSDLAPLASKSQRTALKLGTPRAGARR
jgi:hypothetical protein